MSDTSVQQTAEERIKLVEKTGSTWLNLSKLNLKALPIVGVDRFNLDWLDISQNQLTSLPKDIKLCNQLTTLLAFQNQLTELPPEIGQLTRLESLDVSNNRLTKLPAEIRHLINLTILDMSKNQLKELPTAILSLRNLKELDLRSNNLPIPPEILEKVKEPQAILNYYFSGKKNHLNEVKIIVVGQGSVGKTSLIMRTLENKYNPEENKTEGIDIRKFAFRANNTTYKINVWDFGGQEIMHATHQFFLTKRSLYLLVLDSRLTQEENRVEYWLKIIQSFGGESPVLIVGNKCDQHPLDIDRTGLRKKYPNIVGVLETSAATGKGIDALKASLAEQVVRLPHVHDLLPETWFKVKTALEGLGQESNFITHERYFDLCTINKIINEIDQRTLISFLHDLGVVLYFQEDDRLSELGILNPQWVTNGVYKILNSHALFNNKGVLRSSMLNNILNSPEYPANKRLFIVDMMRKFELCYDIEPDKAFLVPDLLPKDEPFTGDWDDALAFEYHYSVLPSSIISRFIVRMNTYIYKTVWRTGVVIKKDGNIGLVKADAEDKKIFIKVTGDLPTRRDFLSVIRAELEGIHKTITKLEVREKVPVPGRTDIVIDFEHLQKLERLGESSFIPEGLEQHVKVRELLNGVMKDANQLGEEKKDTPSDDDKTIDSRMNGNENTNRNIRSDMKQRSRKHLVHSQKRSIFLQIIKAIFGDFPRIIGRVILEIFGRDKVSYSTHVFVGYIVIVGSVLMLLGFLDIISVVAWVKDVWRFFFPVK